MVSHLAVLLALRGQALTLSVCTTGAQSLSATTTGYARAAGSFVADGIVVGAEILASGFTTPANNGSRVVTAVAATTISCAGCATEAAAAGRTISVGLPAARAWENVAYTPVAGTWYVDEDYLPGPVQAITLGPGASIETLPQYVLTLYGLANTGTTALYKTADALLTLFAPRTALVLSTGDVVTVRTSPAPYRSQLIPADAGWSAIVVTIPCFTRSANTI
jgi:hypothetical protein